MSDAVDTLLWQLRAAKVETPTEEFRFHPARRWRFDLAWPIAKVGLECDGGTWIGGRHVTGSGAEADAEKYSEAAAMGWRIIRVVPDQIATGQALGWVIRALNFGG